MKRKMLVLAAVFFAVTAIEGHALGVGIQFNGNYSSNLVSYGASLLISPNTHSHWAIDWYVGDVLSLGTSFDYWFFTPSVAYLGSGSLHFYLGVGIGGLRPAVNLGFRFWIDGHSGL